MTQGEVTFSEQMRSQTKAAWNVAIGHRFFREVANDTIDDRVFARYLKIEYGFVDCAAAALGYAVAKAPSFRERRHLALGLYGLVTDQEQFFVSAFGRMGISQEQPVGLAPLGLSAPLHDLFLSVANSEGYEEILSCVLAAEWMYLTWCSTAHKTASKRPIIREWVALHAGGAFAEQVAWVRAEIDARALHLTAARKARLGELFEQTLNAEISFHDTAYQ
jgi:thiaminase (transcriptional activator TenA)